MKGNILNYTKYTTHVFFIVLLVYFISVIKVEAALLYFDPLDVEVYRGDTISLDLRLDTDKNECVNTIDGVINYDKSIRAVDVSLGKSILSVWIEPPVIDEEARTISFTGGIPGGYCGRIPGDPNLTNVILKVIFRSPGFSVGTKDISSVRISLDESTQVLLHDGLGTSASTRFQDAIITLLDVPGNTQSDVWREDILNDKELPSDFSITLTKLDTAFGGKYFIVFNSVDKQSGIDHYEVFEEPFSEFWAFKWGRADAPWKSTQSPYVLEDQTLNSTIWVKAIDKAGNERITKLVPDQALQSISKTKKITAIVFLGTILLVIGVITYVVWRKNKILLIKEH